MQYFRMDGRSLCTMTEEEFRRWSPYYGEILSAQLDLWKTAIAIRQTISSRPTIQPLTQPSNPQPAMQPQRHPQAIHQLQQQVPISVPPSFKIEDSLLDISGLVSIMNAATPSPAPSVVDELSCINELGQLSDYGSDVGYRSDEDTMSDDNSDSDRKLDLNRLTVGPAARCPTTSLHPNNNNNNTNNHTGCPTSSHSHIHLWQFLKELLVQPHLYGSCIRWMDRSKGVFKIEDSVRVARLWGKRKNRPAMNYDKLSRSIRQYYKKGIMRKTERSQRLVYQFCHPYFL